MWPATIAVFFVLGALAFLGKRWAYVVFVLLGILFFPARVGFHFNPRPCEFALTIPLALFSLTNWGHDVLFAIFFLMTAVQLRYHRMLTRIGLSFAAVIAFGIYVELAEGLTGKGHCRLRDLVPDTAGGLAGAIVLIVLVQVLRRIGGTGGPGPAR
jgi:hypothetical protein